LRDGTGEPRDIVANVDRELGLWNAAPRAQMHIEDPAETNLWSEYVTRATFRGQPTTPAEMVDRVLSHRARRQALRQALTLYGLPSDLVDAGLALPICTAYLLDMARQAAQPFPEARTYDAQQEEDLLAHIVAGVASLHSLPGGTSGPVSAAGPAMQM
jgi:hypothetical protein